MLEAIANGRPHSACFSSEEGALVLVERDPGCVNRTLVVYDRLSEPGFRKSKLASQVGATAHLTGRTACALLQTARQSMLLANLERSPHRGNAATGQPAILPGVFQRFEV